MTGINNEGANNASGLIDLFVVGAIAYCFLNLVNRVIAANNLPVLNERLVDRTAAQQRAMVPAQSAAVAQGAGAGALTNARVLVMADNPHGGVDIAYQGQHGVGAGHYQDGQLDFVYQGEYQVECNII